MGAATLAASGTKLLMRLSYEHFLALSFWIALVGFASADLRLTDQCVVRFASAEQGIAAITTEDRFTKNLSRFDLQARLNTSGDVTFAQWKKMVAGEVQEWDDDGRAKMTAAVEAVRERLAKFSFPLPDEIYLVNTSGKEEANAAYCRSKHIVIPDVVLTRDPSKIESLLIHELFHVISNQHPELRADLYAIVGFQECPEIAIHPSLKERRITNPDAPAIDCVIKLKEGDKVVRAAPILYSATEDFDHKKEGGLFAHLLFKLMVVVPDGRGWKALDQGGRAVVLDPKGLPDFQEKIGRNTNYIIHPEEILADNFVHLVRHSEKLATPRIVEELQKVLEKRK
jgi:hypothetical protein